MGFLRLSIATLLVLSSIVFVSPARGATKLRTANGENVLIDARNMFKDTEKQITQLSDGVKIYYGGQYISCDSAQIDEAKQEIQAIGHLVISSPTTYVEGDSAVLSYKDNTGVIINGFVKSGQVIFEGKVVRKVAADIYDADDASFTACTTCPTAWTFSGSHIHAEVGGYAYIKNSWLRVAGIPLLPFPYLIIPLKSERQTGFLIPSLDYSASGGAAFSIPFFWAPTRSQDALFTYKHYAKRGEKGLVNYRYVLNNDSGGELNTAFFKDAVFASDLAATQPPGSHNNRWFLTYEHNYDLPDGFVQKTKLNFVSDLKYPRDFPEEIAGQGDSALENRASLSKNTEHSHASVDVDYYVNQLNSNPVAGNGDAVHRWPELRYSLAERPIQDSGPLSKVLFNFNANYVNFARDDLAYDDVETKVDPVTNASTKYVDPTRSGSGTGSVFNPGTDIIRAGQRLDLLPEISYPFHAGIIDALPSLQFRHTQYSFNVSPSPGAQFDPAPSRDYLRGKLSLKTAFSRVYGNRDELAVAAHQPVRNTGWIDIESRKAGDTSLIPLPPVKPNLYQHEIEPELAIASVPYLNQTQSPFFGDASQTPAFLDSQPVSDSDFLASPTSSPKGIQFDYEDRVVNRNTATFSLANHLVRKSWADNIPSYKQIASLKVAQSYDLDEARRTGGQKFPWSDISSTLDVRLDHFETNTVIRHFPYHNKTNTSSRIKLMDDSGEFVQLSFVQNYLITQDPSVAYDGRAEDVGLALGFDSKYLTFGGGIDYAPHTWQPIDLQAKSWQALLNFKPPGNCWGIRITLVQTIGYDPTFKVDFDYKFGGVATAPAATTPSPVASN